MMTNTMVLVFWRYLQYVWHRTIVLWDRVVWQSLTWAHTFMLIDAALTSPFSKQSLESYEHHFQLNESHRRFQQRLSIYWSFLYYNNFMFAIYKLEYSTERIWWHRGWHSIENWLNEKWVASLSCTGQTLLCRKKNRRQTYLSIACIFQLVRSVDSKAQLKNI